VKDVEGVAESVRPELRAGPGQTRRLAVVTTDGLNSSSSASNSCIPFHRPRLDLDLLSPQDHKQTQAARSKQAGGNAAPGKGSLPGEGYLM